MLRTGTVLRSRYKIVQAIGQGGMGAVYEAQDTVLAGRTCAIKEVRLDPDMTLEARRQAQEQFYREASVLARRCRAAGVSVPATDILIAACARHHGAQVEHADSDFDAIARVTARDGDR